MCKLEHKLTVSEVNKVNRDSHDPYASYGTDVPRCIPGSKQYWKSFGLDLVAMTEQRGIPDFFLTLSPNDNWPHIQSTIRKGWVSSMICLLNKRIKCLWVHTLWNQY